uniref:hypothetical protein n=1 Tax=Thaumasiovibrio occultus TaxID=1891184 RepID=UPI000B34F092|nr:hypothetical protein [Thaumasiovibrio occultus]
MQDLTKGLVLFSALLSPLAMADWQLNVDLNLHAPQGDYTSQASVLLEPGEETVFLETDEGKPLLGSAEIVAISADSVTLALTVKQQAADGEWTTLATPTISAGLDNPTKLAFTNLDGDQSLDMAVSITSS